MKRFSKVKKFYCVAVLHTLSMTTLILSVFYFGFALDYTMLSGIRKICDYHFFN